MKKRLGRNKKIIPSTPTLDVDSLTWSDDETDAGKYSTTGSNLILTGLVKMQRPVIAKKVYELILRNGYVKKILCVVAF